MNLKHSVKKFWINTTLVLRLPFFSRRNSKLLKIISNKSNLNEKVKLYFLVTQMEIWLNTKLVQNLETEGKYECILLLFPDFEAPEEEYAQSVRTKIGECQQSNLKYLVCWDEAINSPSIKPAQLDPGFIFYEQPREKLCNGWEIENVCRNLIVLYFPYGMLLADLPDLHYRLSFYFYCHKIFVESIPRKIVFLSHRPMLLNKIKVTGFPKSELLFDEMVNTNDQESFACIWAPHWSVSKDSIISVSSFLSLSDEMVRIAEKYQDIHFKFRPHPRLRHELRSGSNSYLLSDFVTKWNKLPNTSIILGSEYTELLRDSNVLITDSISFLYEFLPTGKASVITTTKDKLRYNFLGKLIATGSYKKIDSIEIEQTILALKAGKDPLKNRRTWLIYGLRKVTKRNSNVNIASQIAEDLKR